MKNIYLIVGPSGVGKTTVVNELYARFGYTAVESYTTRPPRYPGETGHRFVSDAEFDALGPLCAYTVFNGYRYGVPSSMVDESDLYVIDIPGVDYLHEHYDGCKGVRVIALTADVDVLHKRMKKRGDSDDAITARLAHDAKAFVRLSDIADITMRNSDVDATVEAIHEYIVYCEDTPEPTGFWCGDHELCVGDIIRVRSGMCGFLRVAKRGRGYWLEDWSPDGTTPEASGYAGELNGHLNAHFRVADPNDPYREPPFPVYCDNCEETVIGLYDIEDNEVRWLSECESHYEKPDGRHMTLGGVCKACAADPTRTSTRKQLRLYLQKRLAEENITIRTTLPTPTMRTEADADAWVCELKELQNTLFR